MQRTSSLENILILESIEGRRRRDDRRWDHSPIIDGIITLMDMSLTKLWEIVKDCLPQSIESQRVGHKLATEWQQNMPYVMKLTKWKQGDPLGK